MTTSAPRKVKRVLLAEDDEEARKLAWLLIEKLGHTVVAATNGDELKEKLVSDHLLSHKIDVVVTDLRMPGSAPLDVLASLEECEMPLPFILITGLATTEVRSRVTALGGRLLEKPFGTVELRAAFEDLDRRPGPRAGGFTLVELMIVIAIIAIITAIAIPNLVESRKHANSAAAIGALRTINVSESIFREADRDGNGVADYGTLTQLKTAQLVDSVLGSGTKQGYFFAADRSSTTSQFLWFATANPMIPSLTGDRYFETNHAGVVFYTTAGRLALNTTTCTKSAGTLPVGK
jgi:type IV pilus assembly protein PilA